MGLETLDPRWNSENPPWPWVSSSSSSSSCFSPWFSSSLPSSSSSSSSSSWENNNGVGQPSSSDNRKEEDNKKKKPRLSWSAELHQSFLLAVDACGGPQTAVPCEILKIMKVEGLTRQNIASHLQKFRSKSKKTNERFPAPVQESISDLCYCCPTNPNNVPNVILDHPCPTPPPRGLFDMQGGEPDIRGGEPDIRGGEPDIRGGEPDIQGGGPWIMAPFEDYVRQQFDTYDDELMLTAFQPNNMQQVLDNDIQGSESPMLAESEFQHNNMQQQLLDIQGGESMFMLPPFQHDMYHHQQQQFDTQVGGEPLLPGIKDNIQVQNFLEHDFHGNNSICYYTEDDTNNLSGNKRKRVDALGISDVPRLVKTKKARFLWTPSKHQRFVAAVEQLGFKRAMPTKIMELMGVEGLNRHIIASHLQKYRIQLRSKSKKEQGQGQGQDKLPPQKLNDFPSPLQQMSSPEDLSFIDDDDPSRQAWHAEEPLPPVVVDETQCIFDLATDDSNHGEGDADIADEAFIFDQKLKEIKKFLLDDDENLYSM